MSNYKSCLVCLQGVDDPAFNLQCECRICKSCFIEWIVTTNKSTQYTVEEYYSCPNFNCGARIEKDWIYQHISDSDLDTLNQSLLNKYTTNTLDVQKCPSKDCTYAGYIDEYQQQCKDNFICDSCGTRWKVPQKEIPGSTLISFFKSYIYNYDQLTEDLSELRIKMFCSPCFHCGKPVSKIQGCNHITCFCKKEFCYTCLRSWYTHDTQFCLMKRDLMGFIVFMLVLALLSKTIVSSSTIKVIIWNVLWVFLINITAIGLLILNYFVFYFSINILKWDSWVVFMGLVFIQSTAVYWNYVTDYDSFTMKLWVLGIEVVLLLGGTVIGFVLLCLKYICKRR
jgi:hypothetical protein